MTNLVENGRWRLPELPHCGMRNWQQRADVTREEPVTFGLRLGQETWNEVADLGRPSDFAKLIFIGIELRRGLTIFGRCG
jgi:hypothetical protein